MKQMVVDAFALAKAQAVANIREANAWATSKTIMTWYIKEAHRRDAQAARFRAYILRHMVEMPWLPVKGVDDD